MGDVLIQRLQSEFFKIFYQLFKNVFVSISMFYTLHEQNCGSVYRAWQQRRAVKTPARSSARTLTARLSLLLTQINRLND